MDFSRWTGHGCWRDGSVFVLRDGIAVEFVVHSTGSYRDGIQTAGDGVLIDVVEIR